jgi:hypothetical protein
MVLVKSISFAVGFMRVMDKLANSSKRNDIMNHYKHKLTDITEVCMFNSKFYTII